MKHISTTSNRHLMTAATIIAIVGLGAIAPWRIVAQEPAAGPKIDPKICLNPVKFASRGANDPAIESSAQNPTASKQQIAGPIFVDADGQYHDGDRVMGLNKIVARLKHDLDHAPDLIVRVEADQQAPYQSLLALLNRMNDAGIKHVSLRTVSRDTSKPQIFDVAFGVWRPAETKQTGPAAAGRKGDYWNAPGVPWNNDHTESGLKFASGDSSPVQVRMVNLGGGWGNDGTLGIKSPMMDSYNYPVNNQGGDSQVILSNVPPGRYDVYIYGHEKEPWAYGDYTLSVGDHNYGRKTTSNKSDAIENTKWVEGSQYVKFADVEVAAGNNVEILIKPGGEVTDHWGRTFTDATICGLQLIPVK